MMLFHGRFWYNVNTAVIVSSTNLKGQNDKLVLKIALNRNRMIDSLAYESIQK